MEKERATEEAIGSAERAEIFPQGLKPTLLFCISDVRAEARTLHA